MVPDVTKLITVGQLILEGLRFAVDSYSVWIRTYVVVRQVLSISSPSQVKSQEAIPLPALKDI